MRPTTLGVIGLGAIGGSVAWQAVRGGVRRVLGYAHEPRDGAAALRVGALTEFMTDAARLVGRCDLLVLAAPPRATLGLLRELAAPLGAHRTLCTDVTGVKAPVVALAEQLGLGARFAGSHPFAGTHESGFAAARPDLFANRVVYVTPTAAGEQAAAEIADFWRRVMGAQPVTLDAAQHDATLAWTSHLPQAVASALALTLARHAPRGAGLGAGAASTTRLAASSVEMWTDLFLMNREALVRALRGFEGAVAGLVAALEAADAGAVGTWLERGHAWRTRLDA